MEAHQSFMRRAIELAQEAEREGEVPVGAVVVLDESIVGEGFNRPIASSDPSAHAEMVALREAAKRVGNYRLEGSCLYVTIEPCMMCCGALIHARVGHLVFGARESRAGAVVSNAKLLQSAWLNHRLEVTEGVLAEECGDIMREFFRARRQDESES